jgi:hypothetical protein
VGVLTLRPIQRSGYWRVEMAWLRQTPRYFGWRARAFRGLFRDVYDFA